MYIPEIFLAIEECTSKKCKSANQCPSEETQEPDKSCVSKEEIILNIPKKLLDGIFNFDGTVKS